MENTSGRLESGDLNELFAYKTDSDLVERGEAACSSKM